MGWGHSIHVSRNQDGSAVFYTWTDTDPSLGDTTNTTPDIKLWSLDVTTNMASPVINLTDPNGGLYYFMNTSDIVLKQGSTYVIPMSYVDVWETGDPYAAQNHYLITDVTIDESQYTLYRQNSAPISMGQYDFSEINTARVSQNFPNPVKGSTSVKVTLAETSNVSVEITNMLGQSVSVVNQGRLAAGTHNLKLNVTNLNSGIYFYTVTAGTQELTKKMIVE
jgi:hypothetical protein